MNKKKLLLVSLIVSTLTTGVFYNSVGKSKNDNSSSSSSGEYVDCDDLLAKCGDKCNSMNTWMWWKKKQCEKKCQEEYYKCLQNEDD